MIAAARGAATGRRTLYHSELKQLSAKDPVRIQLLDRPHTSRYPGKNDYVRLLVDGSEQERTYEIESPQIYDLLLEAPTHTWLNVRAAGSRDAAVLDLVGREDRAPRAQPAPRPELAAASAAAEPSLARDLFDALCAAHAVVEAYEQRFGREPSDAELRVAASLFIEQAKSGRPLQAGGR